MRLEIPYRATGSGRVRERFQVVRHIRRVGGSDQPKHGGIRSDVVLGIRSRCRRSEGNKTRETEDHEASDRQSSSHEGDGQACSGRGSYAPVTVLVDERDDGVHLSYDRMTSFLSPYENPDALKVARELDSKVERLLNNAAVE